LPIQLNSLLDVLIAIVKTSMMVPIASYIGQLEWQHFILRPRNLRRLQIFDDASHGPWGSAVLAYRFAFRVRAFVVLGLAVVSILALGIDPERPAGYIGCHQTDLCLERYREARQSRRNVLADVGR